MELSTVRQNTKIRIKSKNYFVVISIGTEVKGQRAVLNILRLGKEAKGQRSVLNILRIGKELKGQRSVVNI